MRGVIFGASVAVVLAAAAAIAWAQHGHGSMGAEGHQVAQACATEFEKVVSDGRGFGLAFAADQNGYPGPIHVLELRDRLKLTADQAAKMQELMHTMFAESRPNSGRGGGARRGRRGRARAERGAPGQPPHAPEDARPSHRGAAPDLSRSALGGAPAGAVTASGDVGIFEVRMARC